MIVRFLTHPSKAANGQVLQQFLKSSIDPMTNDHPPDQITCLIRLDMDDHGVFGQPQLEQSRNAGLRRR